MNYLDRNEFNFAPAPEVLKALREFDTKKLGFYTRIYDEGKKSIFSVYLSEEYGIEEERVILGYGGEDILKEAVHYFLTLPDGNRKMFVPKFSWWYYKSIAEEVDGETIQYPLYEDGDTYKYDMEALRRMLKEQQPKILLLASPNNPTGNALSPEEIETLLKEVPESTYIVIDEAYASYVNRDNSYIKRLVDEFPHLLIVRTLSKFYGLPGLRMGFGFMGKDMGRFSRFGNKYLGYNRISEDLAIAALKSTDYYRGIADSMNADRKLYEEELGKLEGFKVYKSQANFILVKYPIEIKEKLQEALKGEDYKIKFMSEPDINTHLRITLGRSEQNRKVIDTIKRVAEAR